MEENGGIRTELERAVENQLKILGVDLSSGVKIAAAVSGGADSIALLTILHRILPENAVLKAVTVNHNIRPSEETEGDAEFVQAYSRSLGVECVRIDIPRGRVEEFSTAFDCGTEDAARRLRYEAFERFKTDCGVDFICLAHNRNDQLETVLMRFISGGDSSALSGIPSRRGFYLRPLIDVTRAEIETYLSSLNVSYRTDATNFDTSMLRNRIRHKLMPVLDADFPGWRNAVRTLSSKMREDSMLIESDAQKAMKEIDFTVDSDGCSFSVQAFSLLQPSVMRRISYAAVDEVGPDSRVPYSFIEKLCRESFSSPDGWKINSSGLEAEKRGGRIYLRKRLRQATETCFSVTIERHGSYRAGEWRIRTVETDGGISLGLSRNSGPETVIFMGKLCFPFMVRSRQMDDSVKTASGTYRQVSKILDDWKCRGSDRDLVPMVQELESPAQEIRGILGSAVGLRDWIVKD